MSPLVMRLVSINSFLNRVDFLVQTEFTANQLLRSLNKPENSLTMVLELKKLF